MSHATRLVAALALFLTAPLVGVVSVASPASATIDGYPEACDANPSYVTDDEYAPIRQWMRAGQVFRIVGSGGIRADGTTRDALVRDFVGCDADGLYPVKMKFIRGHGDNFWRMMWLDER